MGRDDQLPNVYSNLCVATIASLPLPAHKFDPCLASTLRTTSSGVCARPVRLHKTCDEPAAHRWSKPIATTTCASNVQEGPHCFNPIVRRRHNPAQLRAPPNKHTQTSSSLEDSSMCDCTTRSLSSWWRSRYFKKAGERQPPASKITCNGAPASCKSSAWPRRRSCVP